MDCSYELAESMLKLAEKELEVIRGHKAEVVEYAPHIANAVEYLAKALIYAINIDEDICEKTRKSHDVSELLIKVYTQSPIPLQEDDVKAIAGVAFLNAMLCNSVVRGIIRYGVEPLGILFHEATAKTPTILHEWKELLKHAVSLLNKYHGKVENIVKRAESFTIEVTPHSFLERRESNRVVRQAKIIIPTLRPTAKYAHARVRIRLHEELINKTYKVLVKFKAGSDIKAPVRCEVCLWRKEGQHIELANDDGNGSPRDYIYLVGGEGVITVYAGEFNNMTIREIEPRVWKPGGVKVIEVVIEENAEESSGQQHM